MNDLFNRKDILTIATADKAVIGTKGFFGDNLEEIIDAVKRNKIRTLSDVDMLATYNFWSNEEMNYMFFLPAGKVKEKVKEPVYRPIKTIDELFNFLVPGLDTDCDILEKVKLILSRVYELRSKQIGGYLYYRTFTRIYSTNNSIVLDDCTLEYYFKYFEIKKNGEFVPFGIKEE